MPRSGLTVQARLGDKFELGWTPAVPSPSDVRLNAYSDASPTVMESVFALPPFQRKERAAYVVTVVGSCPYNRHVPRHHEPLQEGCRLL